VRAAAALAARATSPALAWPPSSARSVAATDMDGAACQRHRQHTRKRRDVSATTTRARCQRSAQRWQHAWAACTGRARGRQTPPSPRQWRRAGPPRAVTSPPARGSAGTRWPAARPQVQRAQLERRHKQAFRANRGARAVATTAAKPACSQGAQSAARCTCTTRPPPTRGPTPPTIRRPPTSQTRRSWCSAAPLRARPCLLSHP